MKILHLTTHLNIGGISKYILMTGSRFARMGHAVTVVSAGGNMKEEYLKKGIRVYDLPIRTKCEVHPKLILALPEIIRFVKKEKFDLIHAHTRVTQVLGAVVSKMTGVPMVSTFHGFFKRRLGRKLFKCWGSRVIAVSPLVADDLTATHQIPRSRVRVVENAVDIEDLEEKLEAQDREALRRYYGIWPETKVVGCIARLVEDKGQAYLVQAIARLKKDYPNVFLILVGDGRERKKLEKLIKKEGLLSNVLLTPGEPDISKLLTVMDVVTLPATHREGFGLALVEAMIAKKVIVASDIWAINSIIRDRVNGFLVPPKNAAALAETLRYIFQNPSFVESVIVNSYDTAIRLYSIDRMVSELETVYTEVIG